MRHAARFATPLGQARARLLGLETPYQIVDLGHVAARRGRRRGVFRGGPSAGSLLHAAVAQETDTDGDTMPDAWETFFGLNPNDPSDASGDPDGDGLTNAQEFAARRHPVGRHVRYFAEGSTGFFDTVGGRPQSEHRPTRRTSRSPC